MTTKTATFSATEPVNDRYIPPNHGEFRALTDVLTDGRLSGGAGIVTEYQDALATWFGSTHAIAVNSGSSALHAALAALDVGSGDEVIVPATAPIPTALPILTCGATPVIVDVNPEALSIDAADLVAKLTARTKAVITVPLWGYPVDDTAALNVLTEAEIPVIEDACQAHGTITGDRYAGTTGTIGCFSTHDRKLLSTGEGGFLLTDNDQLAEKIDHYTHLGHLKGHTHGVNYKLAAPLAAIGLARLAGLGDQLHQRGSNATRLLQAIRPDSPVTPLAHRDGDIPNYYNLVLVAKTRPENIAAALAGAGLPSDAIRYGYRPLHHQPLFKKYASHCPEAEALTAATLQLPVHPSLTEPDLSWIESQLAAM